MSIPKAAAVTPTDIFANWTLANLLDDRPWPTGRYGYTLMNDHLPTASLSAEINIFPAEGNGQRLPQYSADYLQLSQMGPGRVRFAFDGADQVRLVPVDDRDGQMVWYSNRGDSSDSTLTRAFDLRGLKAATLEYDLWYDIEHLWDYGYVMVSTDGGAHWDILSAPGSTADDRTTPPTAPATPAAAAATSSARSAGCANRSTCRPTSGRKSWCASR
jgi:hypothetical protein